MAIKFKLVINELAEKFRNIPAEILNPAYEIIKKERMEDDN